MNTFFFFVIVIIIIMIQPEVKTESDLRSKEFGIEKNNLTSFVLAVHGGAGSYNRTKVTLEKEINIKKGIMEALKAGYEILKRNGSHLKATQEAIIRLEDNPLFNAGKGAKLNRNFEVEMDASIMDGTDLKCGAVAAVKHIKNPIKAAELVMKETPHIMLASDAADEFAKERGLEYVPNFYFFTMERVEEWFEAEKKLTKTNKDFKIKKKGTVGAVAKDVFGHLAAATSTGGITFKMAGRVGDTPIIGAGNYANDATCAVSCTGEGETIMKRLVAFDVHARMLYKNITLQDSVKEVMSTFPDDTGGFITVDHLGNVEMPFNSSGMARGFVREDGIGFIYIFNKENDLTPVEYDIKEL